jgi:curli biogenesis system outer membrane secretion channel CsgG
MTALRHILATLLAITMAGPALAQPATQPEKPRLAIREIQPTQPVLDAARAQGQAQALAQILAAADSQLIQAVTNTRRFDIVARSDLAQVLDEQDLADAGLLDPTDPQTARAYAMAGARYLATVSVDNFQEATATADFSGGLGRTTMERRTVQLLATVKIYDTTTGTLLDAASIRIEDAEVRESLPGATETGRLTNDLLGRVAERLATQTANAIMDRIAPARVLAYTLGRITLNRGQGTGVEPGQVWRVYHTGSLLVDPDTGEVLGSEEIPVGWARITEVNPRTSIAQALDDTGIAPGAVLRFAPGGLPANVNPDASVTNSAPQPAANQRPQDIQQRPTRSYGDTASQAPITWTDVGATAADDAGPRRVAIFVRDVAADFPDRATDAVEAMIAAAVAGPHTEVISRAVVLNAVSDFSNAGADRGGTDAAADAAARLISDQSSALAMGRTLGADGLLVVTVADLYESRRRFNDPALGVDTDLSQTHLTLAWTLIDASTGAAVTGGHADATARSRRSDRVQSTPPDLGSLIRDAAGQVGRQVQAAAAPAADGGAGRARDDSGEAVLEIRVAMEELSVPEIRRIDGEWVVTGARIPLQPAQAEVLVDGFLVGTAPGAITMAPGPHRLRVQGAGLEPIDRFVVARDAMTLTLPMRLSEEGRRRWREHAAFLETLREGAVLRDNEQKLAEGLAEFLSNARINLDTSAIQRLDLSPDAAEFWLDLLDR